jgi:hypothetical protein
MSGSQDEQLDCPRKSRKLLYLQILVCFSYLTADSIGSYPATPVVTLGSHAYDLDLKVICECFDKQIAGFLLCEIILVIYRSPANIK